MSPIETLLAFLFKKGMSVEHQSLHLPGSPQLLVPLRPDVSALSPATAMLFQHSPPANEEGVVTGPGRWGSAHDFSNGDFSLQSLMSWQDFVRHTL